ncbi:nucleotidyltransferase [Candidatus Woesearchaeota archaeon]|nr:nucleotidyltransferase [Candidatus Woesearchaeota archaeon]
MSLNYFRKIFRFQIHPFFLHRAYLLDLLIPFYHLIIDNKVQKPPIYKHLCTVKNKTFIIPTAQSKVVNTKELKKFIKGKTKNPVFYSLSGAHLYGFASKDSDYDIRGCHVEPTRKVLGLQKPRGVVEAMEEDNDFVSQEIEKFIGLMLKPNGNVLEQLYSPIKLVTSKEHRELKKLAKGCFCKRLYFHYNGMAMQNYKKFLDKGKNTVKKYLYVLRSLMTGTYLLEKGKLEPNINETNKYFKSSIVKELIKLKTKEQSTLPRNSAIHNKAQKQIADLFYRLKESREKSKLPEEPKNKEELNEFLIKTRVKYLK